MSSLIRTIRRRLEREGSLDTAFATVPKRDKVVSRKRTKGGRKAETYRAARRAAAIAEAKANRRYCRRTAKLGLKQQVVALQTGEAA